jgi:hypothetical protein
MVIRCSRIPSLARVAGREGGVEPDRQVSGLAAADGLGSVNDNLQLIENPPNAADKVPACRRRPHAAIRPFKQCDPELLLKMSDSSAEIGLLEGEQFRCLAKAATAFCHFSVS